MISNIRSNLAESGRRVWKWFAGWLHLGPHFVVGDPKTPYLKRWYILPRNPWLNVYLHQFCRDDDDRACHDHPWRSLSLVLFGRYREHTKDDQSKDYGAGSIIRREAEFAHRIELPKNKDGKPRRCWTLFITGAVVREWGFHCPQGWRHWREFTKQDQPGQIGKGCED